MTSHDLLQAILEQPDDDAPRLVFADWLEEHGEPVRAEFIRRQCQLANVPEYDALWQQTYHRERQWLSGHKMNLPEPALPEGLRWPPFGYRRGFLSELDVRDFGLFLAHAAELFQHAPIEALDIDTRNLQDPKPLTQSPWLARIRRLKLVLGRMERPRSGVRRVASHRALRP